MDIESEMQNLMDACGGEDLIRYLLREDGVFNWETINLHPIVAYEPKHMNKAMVCGIAYWDGLKFNIIHSEEKFGNSTLQEWVNSITISKNYEYSVEALLSLNRAIVVTPQVKNDSERMSWEAIELEVIYGYRSNNYSYYKKEPSSALHHMPNIGNLFDILLGVSEGLKTNISSTKKNGIDFSDEFKSEWA